MQIDNRMIMRSALQLIRCALAELSTSSLGEPAMVRLARLHALYNVTDHVLGIMTNPYVSDAFKAEHMRYSTEWRENLNIRTCSYCGTYAHDSHAVPCESPIGAVFVFCETCAILNGFASVCTQCTLVYAHSDTVSYVPSYLRGYVRHDPQAVPEYVHMCVDCFPTLSSPCTGQHTATGPA